MPLRIEKLCVDKGLRMTEQRRVIARVLSDAHDHPDAEELHRRAAAIDPRISIATVYRTVRGALSSPLGCAPCSDIHAAASDRRHTGRLRMSPSCAAVATRRPARS